MSSPRRRICSSSAFSCCWLLASCVLPLTLARLRPSNFQQFNAQKATENLSIFILLQAFASGCSAMTGVEAISDGVPAFKEPEYKNAQTTLGWMAVILGIMFLGITILAHIFILCTTIMASRCCRSLGRAVFGSGSVFYYFLQAFTTIDPCSGREHIFLRLPAPLDVPGPRQVFAAHL